MTKENKALLRALHNVLNKCTTAVYQEILQALAQPAQPAIKQGWDVDTLLDKPLQEPTDNGITVDLLERLKATLTRLGYATPEGGLEAFGARLPEQLYNLCRAVDGLLKAALAQPAQEKNFCPRCGKRLASGFVEISIHTCTPPSGAKQ